MKKIIFLCFALGLIALFAFVNFEPGLTTAASSQATTTVSLTVESEISVTCSTTIAMSPNITLSQDSSVGNTGSCYVSTTDTNGYLLTVRSTTTPAIQTTGGDYFEDVATTTHDTWANQMDESKNLFGFSVYGTDVSTALWGNYTGCGSAGASGITHATALYTGFDMITATTTASKAAAANSEYTFVCLSAEQGNTTSANSGAYQATLEFTATTQ